MYYELVATRPKPFVVLGIVFLILGALSFLTVAQGWYLAQTVLPRAGIYGLLDLLVAYGFFARQWWLVPAFGLNALGQLALIGVRAAYTATPLNSFLFACFGAALAVGLFWYTYRKRDTLLHDRASYVLCALFVLSWGAGFWYALSGLIGVI